MTCHNHSRHPCNLRFCNFKQRRFTCASAPMQSPHPPPIPATKTKYKRMVPSGTLNWSLPSPRQRVQNSLPMADFLIPRQSEICHCDTGPGAFIGLACWCAGLDASLAVVAHIFADTKQQFGLIWEANTIVM